MSKAWTTELSEGARAEGWDLFAYSTDSGELRHVIQKLDEADVFESDAEAVHYVYVRAVRHCDEKAIAALTFNF